MVSRRVLRMQAASEEQVGLAAVGELMQAGRNRIMRLGNEQQQNDLLLTKLKKA